MNNVLKSSKSVGVFILSKNEEANIEKCLVSFQHCRWKVHVLDSGSVDRTSTIVARYPFAKFETYNYTNHCKAYNDITESLGADYDCVIVLDSDMELSCELQHEIIHEVLPSLGRGQAFLASVLMYSEGSPLHYASLCPPKPFLFSTGLAYFESIGHSERLRKDVLGRYAKNRIVHNDLKSYLSYLSSQFRYAGKLADRYHENRVSFRDRVRVNTPILIFAVPILSYFLRFGFLDGRAGLIYAVDRLIAEAIMYRQALASRIKNNT